MCKSFFRCFGVLAFAAFLTLSYPVMAQDESDPPDRETAAAEEASGSDDAIVLPEASIMAKRETAEHVSQEQMIERGDTNLFEAMRWIPGLVTNGGHAGQDLGGLSIRGIGGGGHGTDYLTVMADGIPLSDLGGYGTSGRIDYAGILTGGLESIDVAKGYTSVLLGPNIMAGALMLRTAKPQRRLELAGRTGFDFDGGGFGGNTTSLSAGTRFGMFYARAGFNNKYVDHWRLPDSYEPGYSAPPEEGGDPQQKGNRIFTNANALGVNLMLGAEPLDDLDVWATYAYSSRTILKGGWTPPRAGCSVGDAGWNFWGTPTVPDEYAYVLTMAFPYRNRHDATLHAEWTPDRLSLGLHGYYNLYEQRQYSPSAGFGFGPTNVIWPAIENDQYTVSDLNTYTFGINLNGGYEINDWNKIEGSLQFRQNGYDTWSGFDIQENPEHNDTYMTKSFVDNIFFGGVEYTVNPIKPFTIIAGFGLDMMAPTKMDRQSGNPRTPQKSDVANFIAMPQWTTGLFYDLTEQHELHFTYAKKNRFPSFSEKESAEESPASAWGPGTKANMDLKPQEVHHTEFGYKGYFLDRIRITSALFLNYELNKIASVPLENDPDGYGAQYQNVDKNMYYGFELGTEMFLNDYFTIGGSLAINKYKVLYSEAKDENGDDYERMGNSPQLVTNGYMSISPFAGMDMGKIDRIRLMPRFEYVGARYAGSDNNLVEPSATVLDDYMLLHFAIFVDIAEHYQASFAIHNMLDQLYYPQQWMPAAGRSFNISFGVTY